MNLESLCVVCLFEILQGPLVPGMDASQETSPFVTCTRAMGVIDRNNMYIYLLTFFLQLQRYLQIFMVEDENFSITHSTKINRA